MLLLLPLGPWPIWYFSLLDKFPSNTIATAYAQKISNSRAHFDACVTICIRLRSIALENVLPVIVMVGADIFPLCITYLAAVVDGEPLSFAC